MRTLHLSLRVTDLERSSAFTAALGYEMLGAVPEIVLVGLTMLVEPAVSSVAARQSLGADGASGLWPESGK